MLRLLAFVGEHRRLRAGAAVKGQTYVGLMSPTWLPKYPEANLMDPQVSAPFVPRSGYPRRQCVHCAGVACSARHVLEGARRGFPNTQSAVVTAGDSTVRRDEPGDDTAKAAVSHEVVKFGWDSIA